MKVVFVNALHPLGELIESVLSRNGWSTRDLAARSRVVGEYMSHTNFGRLKNEPLVSIKGSTVKILARVLQVPEAVVAAAALDSMGVDRAFNTSPDIAAAVHTSIDLSARDRKIILAVIEAMRDENGQPHEQSHLESQPEPHDEPQHHAEGALTDEKMDSFDLAAYDTGQPETMKQARVREQDTHLYQSQDPDDHEGYEQ